MTEKSGRVHTSAVSVAILPQADEVPLFLLSFSKYFKQGLAFYTHLLQLCSQGFQLATSSIT